MSDLFKLDLLDVKLGRASDNVGNEEYGYARHSTLTTHKKARATNANDARISTRDTATTRTAR